MKTTPRRYYTPRQGKIPVYLTDFLSITEPVLAFDRFMEGIDLSKYLKNIPEYITGRNRYNPVDMLKTELFAFADNGYCSLRKLEDNCKVNMRCMYLMNWKTPSCRAFGYFINEELRWSGLRMETNEAYVPEYLGEMLDAYAKLYQLDEASFVYGRGRRKTIRQRRYGLLRAADGEVPRLVRLLSGVSRSGRRLRLVQ